jgi:flagellar basal-body rod protein FlgF
MTHATGGTTNHEARTEMQSATYVALSSQMALRRQMDVVSNNIANAATPAYKGEHMMFAELVKAQSGQQMSFVQDVGTYRDTKQGALTRTGNPLDIALDGEGYLKVQTPLGMRYTRNGRLQLDATGQAVTAQGYPVLAEGDTPLIVPTDAHDITVTKDGTVTTDQGQAAKFAVVKFANENDLAPASAGLYVTEATPVPAPETGVMQGMVEESNIQPVVEMTRMMSVAQDFAAANNLLQAESDREKSAIDKLGRVA